MSDSSSSEGVPWYLVAYAVSHSITGQAGVATAVVPMASLPVGVAGVDRLGELLTADLRAQGVLSGSRSAMVLSWSLLGAGPVVAPGPEGAPVGAPVVAVAGGGPVGVGSVRADVMDALAGYWGRSGEPFELHAVDESDVRVEVGEQTFRLRIEQVS